MFIGTGASLNLTGSTITKNHANGGNARGGGNAQSGQGVGGGVYNLGVFVNIANVIMKNDASTSNDDIFP